MRMGTFEMQKSSTAASFRTTMGVEGHRLARITVLALLVIVLSQTAPVALATGALTALLRRFLG